MSSSTAGPLAGKKRKRSASIVSAASRAEEGEVDWGGARTSHPEVKHGNFDSYEGFEPPNSSGNVVSATGEHREDGRDVLSDPRLKALPPGLLKDASILEIGCGAGYLCAELAERHGAKEIVGVDIDARLVSKARTILDWRKAVWREKVRAATTGSSSSSSSSSPSKAPLFVPLSMRTTQRWRHCAIPSSPLPADLPADDDRATATATATTTAEAEAKATLQRLNNVRFLCSDILLHPCKKGSGRDDEEDGEDAASSSSAAAVRKASLSTGAAAGIDKLPPPPAWTPPLASFDVVLCFNVTKYVHLNAGDEGLTRLFRIAHSYLKPGGRFLLVAQRWASYNKHRNLHSTFAGQMSKMTINPDKKDEFLGLLTGDRVRFSKIEAVLSATKPSAGRKLTKKQETAIGVGVSSDDRVASSSAASSSSSDAAGTSAAPVGRLCELLVLRK